MISINRFANVFKSKKQNKDKLLYKAIYNKVNRKEHKYEEPQDWDGTLIKCTRLLQNCADPNQLKLSAEDLQTLSSEQQKYYFKCFLPKLSEQIKQSKKISGKIKGQVERVILQITRSQSSNAHRASYDSAYESGSDIESDDNSVTSGGDTTPLISKPNSRKTHFEEPISEEKTSSVKKRFRGIRKKAHGGFKRVTRVWRRIEKSVVNKKKEENTIPLSFANLCYDPASTNQEIVNDFVSTNGNAETQISNEIKNDSNCLLEAVKKKDEKQFKDHLESGADITIQDEEGNNILHLIASLRKKQKYEFLDELNNKIQKKDLEQLINSQNKDGKTPLQIALIAKIEKEEHKSNKPRDSDNTLKFLSRLLKLGANPNQLELSEESLKKLSEKQKDYYRHFLKKLAKLVKNPQLNKEITNKVIIKVAQIIDDDGYPLHSAVRDGEENKFNELLQRGYDITTQDAEGNTVLHYAIKLERTIRYYFTTLILKNNKELLNTKNNDGLTPIYILLERIQKKNKDRSCTDRKFEKTGRYKILKLLLENSADITTQDNKGDNVLHRIALLEGEQKVTCLKLIVRLVEKDKFSQAANAINTEERTPLQVVLIAKITKDNHKWINPKSRDNTIKFCVKLLQNGVDPKQLILSYSLWNREYYKTIKGIEKSIGRSLISDNIRTDLKCNFGKKFKARDIVKYLNNVVCKVVTTLVFAALTCAVIFSAFQGSIAIETALPIIAAIGACYLIYLNVENIYKGFGKIKEKFTAEEQVIPQDNTDLMQRNNSDENIENKPKNQAAQKLSDQLECAGAPNTNMSEISMVNKFINRLRTLVNIPG